MKWLCNAVNEPLSVEVICPHCHESSHLELGLKQRGLAPQCILLCQDMPGLWLAMFLGQHMNSAERLALFRTCKDLANLVMKHCHKLRLQPAACLQSNCKGRAVALGLAAGCNNIHLHVTYNAVILDTSAIWPCITHVSLNNLTLSRSVISSLCLLQLTSLHTIQLDRSSVQVLLDDSDINRLSKAMQAGALPALRTLHGNYDVLSKLAPVLGTQITELVLHGSGNLAELGTLWPVLQDLEIHSVPSLEQEVCQLLKQLCNHPAVQHVKLPCHLLMYYSSALQPSAWDSLEVTGGFRAHLLQSFPLQRVRHLLLLYSVVASTSAECDVLISGLAAAASWRSNQFNWAIFTPSNLAPIAACRLCQFPSIPH